MQLRRPVESRVRLLLFDGPRLERGAEPLPAPLVGLRLLAYLALCGPATRRAASSSLWPRSSREHALANLRTAMWRLRGTGEALLECDRDALRLRSTVHVDAREFRAAARRVIMGDSEELASELEFVTEGSGDLLPGWDDMWVLLHRERFRQQRMHLLEVLSARLLERRRLPAALEMALEVLQMEPLRESAHCAVIAVYKAEGNHVEALRQFASFRKIARDELGVDPSPGMVDLVFNDDPRRRIPT